MLVEPSVGAALWSAPGRWHVGLGDQWQIARGMLGSIGLRIVPALRTLAVADAVHPKEPHYYLRVLGCDPVKQGRGVGASLVAPMLERCDREAMPAYLESSNPKNLGFYRRCGFETMSVVETPLGVPITRMWRAPKPTA